MSKEEMPEIKFSAGQALTPSCMIVEGLLACTGEPDVPRLFVAGGLVADPGNESFPLPPASLDCQTWVRELHRPLWMFRQDAHR